MNREQEEKRTQEIVIDAKNGDVTEQIQKLVAQNNVTPMNRAQRRAMAKKNKKQEKRLQRYLINHPEAMKIDWDEEAVKEVEEKEKNEQDAISAKKVAEKINETIETSSMVNKEEIIDVPFTEVGEIMDDDELEIENE